MSLRLRQFVVSLIATLSLLGCSRSNEPSVPNAPTIPKDATKPPEVIELTEDNLHLFDPEELVYVHCEDREAETILVIRVTVPNAMNACPFRIPLCRRKTRKLEPVPRRSIGAYADGVSADGFGIGHGAHYYIADATDSRVNVSFSLYWTANDRTRGSFSELLAVTIGEPSAKELDENIIINWSFQDPVVATGTEIRHDPLRVAVREAETKNSRGNYFPGFAT